MDAMDYVLTQSKICKTYACEECPLCDCCDAMRMTEEKARKLVETVWKWREKQANEETENLLKATFEKITGKKDAAEVRIEGKSIVIGTDFESIRIGGDDGKA